MQIHKLTDSAIKAILRDADKKPGRYTDGGGLYLVKTKGGTGCWVLMYRQGKRIREMGLGSYDGRVGVVTLQQARAKALAARAKIGAGEDPLKEKQRSAPAASFRSVMEKKVSSLMTAWGRTAEKNRKDWISTLTNHAGALLDVPVARITTERVLEVLRPIWTEKRKTADLVRGRIALILDYAKAGKLREGDNPAEQKIIHNLLGAQKALAEKKENMKAMASAELQPFWARLGKMDMNDLAARALALTVLTGARSGEVREMVWSEVDLDKGLWTIPGARMKAHKDHTVTLSRQAVELLEALPRYHGSETVFWSGNGKPFSGKVMMRKLRSMGYTEEQATVHGFRSSFVSWARDAGHNETIAQVAIAHAVGGQVEQAYQHGKALAIRFDMLQAWADFLDSPTVVPFRKVA